MKKARNQREDIERKQHQLQQLADSAMRLADELSIEGRPLTEKETKLLRMASLPCLEECLESMTTAFLTGRNVEDLIPWLQDVFND